MPPADDGPGAPWVDDPEAALRRLENMGRPAAAGPSTVPSQAARPDPLPPSPVVDTFTGPPPRQTRGVSGAKRVPRARPAGGPRSSGRVARIAAPVVFLVAVIALLGIIVNSGVMGSDEPTPTPAASATKANGGVAVTKKYVVREGDSLSSIAVRFGTTTSQLKELNPDLSGTTLVVGQRLVVPAE
jgi:nucleoid-associated protein YgaU